MIFLSIPLLSHRSSGSSSVISGSGMHLTFWSATHTTHQHLLPPINHHLHGSRTSKIEVAGTRTRVEGTGTLREGLVHSGRAGPGWRGWITTRSGHSLPVRLPDSTTGMGSYEGRHWPFFHYWQCSRRGNSFLFKSLYLPFLKLNSCRSTQVYCSHSFL